MNLPTSPFTFSLLSVAATCWLVSCNPSTAATDFNIVGKQVAARLQNSHYSRLPFDKELSQRFLDSYIDTLDPSHLYFTKSDIDTFNKKYGKTIHEFVLSSRSSVPAKDIFDTFHQRVSDRIRESRQILKNEKFTFDSNRTVERSREKADWPKDEAEAQKIWRDRLEEQVLSEILRRENLTKIAKEQGKEDPNAKEKTVEEKIAIRYDRILQHFDSLDDEDIISGFLNALTLAYDPHSSYMSGRDLEKFYSAISGKLIGVGALLQSEDDGATKISGIVKGGPIDKSGEIQLNDRIVGVDRNGTGEMTDIMFMPIDKVVELVRGKENSTVILKIESPQTQGKIKLVKLVRQPVEMKDEQAKGEIINTSINNKPVKIGYLNLPGFYVDMQTPSGRSCADDIKLILERMVKENIDGLIFDVRNNGGGSLEAVCQIGGFFTGKGPAVQVKRSDGKIETRSTRQSKPIFTGPVIIMTNKLSASASEILAGQLQDYGRAIIVGRDSYGKGTVQQAIDLSNYMPYFSDSSKSGAVKLTIQKFYRVAGSSTQLSGVKVDIPIPSVLDGLTIGEDQLKYPLEHDNIPKADSYSRSTSLDAILPMLKEKSEERIKNNIDFKAFAENTAWTKEKAKENKISLNKKEREIEVNELEIKRKATLKKDKERFAKIAEEDKKLYSFQRLSLEDVKKEVLPPLDHTDEEQYMRMAKNELDDLELSVDYPSGLDPEKRETLHIMQDWLKAQNKVNAETPKNSAPKN